MANLTRILNNQIYNQTIIASQKIAPGTITGTLFASNVTVPGDLLITGNLFVLGASAQTTIASTNTYVNDPLIALNNGFSGTNTYDEGLIFNRGSANNTALIWSEHFQEFRLIYTAETGTTYGNINAISLANLSVGNFITTGTSNIATLFSATATILNAYHTTLNVTGNVLTGLLQASAINSTPIGNATPSTGVFTTVSGGGIFGAFIGNSGAILSGASLNVSGNVLASIVGTTTLNAVNINASGNVLTGLLQAAAINSTPIGNATPSTAAFTTLTSSGITTVTNTTQSTAFGSGAFQVTGGASIGGNLWIGGNLNVLGNNFTISGNVGVFYGNAAGAGALYAGVAGYTPQPFTTIQSTGNYNGYIQINNQNLNNGTNASTDFVATMDTGNTTQGYIDMGINSSGFVGGAGNELNYPGDGYLYVLGNAVTGSGNLLLSTSLANDIVFALNGQGSANEIARFNNAQTAFIIKSTTASTNRTSGALQIAGGAGISGALNAGQTQLVALNNTPIGNATPSTGVFTTVSAGGVFAPTIGNTGAIVQGLTAQFTGNVIGGLAQFAAINSTPIGNATPSTGAFTTLSASQAVTFNYGVNSTSATNGGTMTITGGAAISQDLWVGGNLYAANIIGIQANIITTEDPLLYLSTVTPYPYNYDIGLYSQFTGAGLSTLGNVNQTTGIVRDNANNTWTFFSNMSAPTGATFAWNASTVYDPIKAGNLTLVNTTLSSSASTGALIVAGGAGIGGNIFMGGAYADTSSSNFIFAGTPTTANVFASATSIIMGAAGPSNTLTLRTGTLVGVTGTQNVFNTVTTTVNAFGTATNLTIGATSGTANIRNANIWFPNATTINSGQATVALLNTGVTTVNAFGAATALNIGAGTGTTTINNGLVVAGAINATLIGNATPSTGVFTTATAGQLNSGFIGNTGTAFTGASLNVTGNVLASTIDATTLNTTTLNASGNVLTGLLQAAAINSTPIGNATASTATFTALQSTGVYYANLSTVSTNYASGAIVSAGGVGINGNLNLSSNNRITLGADLAGNIVYPENIVQIVANANSAVRSTIINVNNGTNSTAEFYAGWGSNVSNFITTGIAGPKFSKAGVPIIPGDGYSLVQGGNYWLGSESNSVSIIAGGLSTTNTIAIFSSVYNNVSILSSAVATSQTTGALTVIGGFSTQANIWAGTGATFNAGQGSNPVTIKGVSDPALFVAVPGANGLDSVIISGQGNTTPSYGAAAKFGGTGGIQIPSGTSAQRPGSSGNVDLVGMVRYNTTTTNLEYCTTTGAPGTWVPAGSVFTVVSDRQFVGNVVGGYGNVDGTNTTFTLQSSATTSGTIVSINGVMQFPVLAYSVSGSTLTFTEPPAPTDIIDVRVLTTTASVSALASGNGLNQFIADPTGSSIWTGTNSTVEQILVDPVGNFNFKNGNHVTYTQTPVNIPATATPVLIDTWNQNTYSDAKYLVHSEVGTTNFESYEARVITDSNGNAYISTYGIVNNGTSFGTFSANVVGGNVNVYYSSTIAQANVKTFGTYIV